MLEVEITDADEYDLFAKKLNRSNRITIQKVFSLREQSHGGNNKPPLFTNFIKGEALSGNKDMGIDAQVLDHFLLHIWWAWVCK